MHHTHRVAASTHIGMQGVGQLRGAGALTLTLSNPNPNPNPNFEEQVPITHIGIGLQPPSHTLEASGC